MPWSQFIIQLLLTIISLIIAIAALKITYYQTNLLDRQINIISKSEQPNFIAVIEPNGPITNNRYPHIDLSIYADLSFVKNNYIHVERLDALELELNKVGLGSERYKIPITNVFSSCGRVSKSKNDEVYKCHGLNNGALSVDLYEKFYVLYNASDEKIYANGFTHYFRISYEDLEGNQHAAYVAVSSRGELDFQSAKNGYDTLKSAYDKIFVVGVTSDPKVFIKNLKDGYESKFLNEFFSDG